MIIHDVEQNTPEWLHLRAGMPTASEFSKLITSTGAASKSMIAYAQELAGEVYAGQPLNGWEGNQYTERGHDLEDEARASYGLLTGAEVTQVGFVTDDLQRWGCSPDGLVGDDGLLEIKCLPKKHIGMLLYWHKHKKCPPDFIQQVQGQMWITGRAWCDLYFYQPHLPDLVIRVEPDEKLVDALKEQLTECLIERDRTLDILEAM